MNRKPYFLSDVFEIIGGGTPRTTEPKYWNGPIPWLSVVDFNSDARYVYSTEKTITELGLVSSSTKLLNKGDLIISARGTVGAIAQIPSPMAFNQSCYGLRAKPDLLESNYGYYLLKDSVSTLKNNAHGGVFDTITRDTFKTILVELPGLESQKRISSFLGSLDHYIENLVRQNSTLESIAQTLFKSWFVNFDPVHAKAAGLEPEGLSTEMAALFPSEFEESELGFIPMGWHIKTVEQSTVRLKPAQVFSEEDCKDILGTPLFDQSSKIFVGYTEALAEVESSEFSPAFLFGDHTCVMRLHSESFNISANVIPLKANHIDGYWLYYAMKGLQKFESYRRHWSELKVKKLLIPSENLMASFGSVARDIHKNIENNEKLCFVLSRIRDELLPRLISGKIRIEEAQEALESVLPPLEKKVA